MNMVFKNPFKGMTSPKAFKCVIIDDDLSVRNIISAKLSLSDNYEVHTACDGEEGLKLVHEISPNFVLLDWMMPNMSGLEVLKKFAPIGRCRTYLCSC